MGHDLSDNRAGGSDPSLAGLAPRQAGLRVLAVDPGEKVGWARGTVTPAGPHHVLQVEDHGIAALKPFATKLASAIEDYDVVVYESYRISAAKAREHIGSDVPTLQLIGMIRLCAWMSTTKLVRQQPSQKDAARASLPDWLRSRIAALPARHDESHDGDALLHLWLYYFTDHFDPTNDPL